ncbi:hypothetical protein [Sphingomonas sp. R86521]|uniref:hypothetical protein n=1 Tax=Sphingomonas sp. R86521 TaxID=3093860 RepID=UPI0036D23B74
MIAKGAPIDLLGSQLVSISTAAIPSTRFRVSATPVAAALPRKRQEAVRAGTNPSTPTPDNMLRRQDRFIKRAV